MDSFRYNLINVTHLLLLCLFSPLSPHHHHVLRYMNALSSTQNYYLPITQNLQSINYPILRGAFTSLSRSGGGR